MGSLYGAGPYGEGRYGGANLIEPILPEADRRPHPAQHLLGIGPWAENVQWKAANYKLTPTASYPAVAVLSLSSVQVTSCSVTLRRTEPSDARVDITQPRGRALLVEEMVTDLWWERRDPLSLVNEPIGRFNADAVSTSLTGDRLTTSATFVDWRGVLEDRLEDQPPVPATGWPAATRVTDILAAVIPTNMQLDLTELSTVDLGVTTWPLEYAPPITVTDVIDKLRVVSPPFDWAIEPGPARGDRPRLRLWPGSRGSNRGVTLIDAGDGLGSITTWRRRTNARDYANWVYFQGANLSQVAYTRDTYIPTGQRDAVGNDAGLISADVVQNAADKMLAERQRRLAAWDIELAPGFWRGRSHIDLGDSVRVIVRLGDELIDETHTVEEISVELSADGYEQVSLALGWGTPSTNPQSRLYSTAQILKQLRRLSSRR